MEFDYFENPGETFEANLGQSSSQHYEHYEQEGVNQNADD